MAAAKTVRKAFDQLYTALTDKVRGNRAMLLLLTFYVATWTLYGSVSRSSQDLHPDMTELIAWSRDLGLGYLKHPPLAAWVVWLWFSVFPLNDLSYYLLAILMPGIALWFAWQLSADYLETENRFMAVALLMLVPFYNFHALKFNVNTVLLPAWAATTFFFLRSYKTCSWTYSALAGIGAAASMLGKYWSVFLIAGLALASLFDFRRSIYFRSAAPWITAITAFALLGPHLLWLYQQDLLPFEYAIAKHVTRSFTDVAVEALSYFAGSVAYVAAPILFVLVLVRPNRTAIADMLWPSDNDRRLAVTVFWGSLLLPVVGALVGGVRLTSLWSMPAWTLLPVVLLSSPAVRFDPINLRRILAVAVVLPVVMLIAAPAIAIGIHMAGVTPLAAHGRLLAAETERHWHQATSRPLRFVGCNAANAVITYAADQPRPLPMRSFRGHIADIVYADAHGWPQRPPAESWLAEVGNSGMALVCLLGESDWVQAAAAQVAHNPESRRVDIEIARKFLGIPGVPQRYVMFVIPPVR
jgi:4-amino-4-deoxy-L-arabinose transferase-like glycosyltransferase